jgi:hypothetical protein
LHVAAGGLSVSTGICVTEWEVKHICYVAAFRRIATLRSFRHKTRKLLQNCKWRYSEVAITTAVQV